MCSGGSILAIQKSNFAKPKQKSIGDLALVVNGSAIHQFETRNLCPGKKSEHGIACHCLPKHRAKQQKTVNSKARSAKQNTKRAKQKAPLQSFGILQAKHLLFNFCNR
jgi:hypothetical protein